MLCLGWLTVGCQEEIATEVQPIVEPTATKKSGFTNARLIDSTLVYDLTVTVLETEEVRVESRFGSYTRLKEGDFVDEYSGTLTLTANDPIPTVDVENDNGTVSNVGILYAGEYTFTTQQGESFTVEAQVRSRNKTLLNPGITGTPVDLVLFNLPEAVSVPSREFELSEDFATPRSEMGNVGTNEEGTNFFFRFTATYQTLGTPLPCGVSSVKLPNPENTLIQPGDRFTISEELQQTPGLARVEYIHEPRGTFGSYPTADPDLFLGTAAGESNFSIAYQLPQVAVFDADRVFANLFDAAGNLLRFKVPALLIQDGQLVPLIRIVEDDTTFVPITFLDSDHLIRRSDRIELFDDQDQLIPQGGTVEISYEAECDAQYDASFFVIPPGEDRVALGERNGRVSVSVNGGPAQELDFNDEEYTRVGLVRGPVQLSDTRTIVPAPVTLNLEAGNNIITVTALDDRPINLYRVRISEVPNPASFDHQ